MNILLSDKVIDFLDATREKSRAAEVSKLLEILAAEHFNNKGKNNNIKVSALESASVFSEISSSHLKSITSSLDFHHDHSRTC